MVPCGTVGGTPCTRAEKWQLIRGHSLPSGSRSFTETALTFFLVFCWIPFFSITILGGCCRGDFSVVGLVLPAVVSECGRQLQEME